MRLFLQNSLSAEYTIAEATNKEEAMARDIRSNPDLIVSDSRMPSFRVDELGV